MARSRVWLFWSSSFGASAFALAPGDTSASEPGDQGWCQGLRAHMHWISRPPRPPHLRFAHRGHGLWLLLALLRCKAFPGRIAALCSFRISAFSSWGTAPSSLHRLRSVSASHSRAGCALGVTTARLRRPQQGVQYARATRHSCFTDILPRPCALRHTRPTISAGRPFGTLRCMHPMPRPPVTPCSQILRSRNNVRPHRLRKSKATNSSPPYQPWLRGGSAYCHHWPGGRVLHESSTQETAFESQTPHINIVTKRPENILSLNAALD